MPFDLGGRGRGFSHLTSHYPLPLNSRYDFALFFLEKKRVCFGVFEGYFPGLDIIMLWRLNVENFWHPNKRKINLRSAHLIFVQCSKKGQKVANFWQMATLINLPRFIELKEFWTVFYIEVLTRFLVFVQEWNKWKNVKINIDNEDFMQSIIF